MRYLALLIALMIPLLAEAADHPALRMKNIDAGSLFHQTAFRCQLGEGVSMQTENGQPIAVPNVFSVNSSDGLITFTDVNLKNGSANFTGNNGIRDIKVTAAETLINLIEPTPSGNVVLYTIFGEKNPANGDFLFVMSKHTTIGGVANPSQYFGSCKPLKP